MGIILSNWKMHKLMPSKVGVVLKVSKYNNKREVNKAQSSAFLLRKAPYQAFWCLKEQVMLSVISGKLSWIPS